MARSAKWELTLQSTLCSGAIIRAVAAAPRPLQARRLQGPAKSRPRGRLPRALPIPDPWSL